MKKVMSRIIKLLKFLDEISKPNGPTLITTKNSIICKGKESYHNGNFIVKGRGGVLEVGSYCAIGKDVKVILSNHDLSKVSMQYSFYRKYFNFNIKYDEIIITKIENDVWIGDNVIILPGVHIATGSVLGAGAIITKNVEPYAIVAGNPARIIRKRFSNERMKELLDSKWWEWDEEKIKMNRDFFI